MACPAVEIIGKKIILLTDIRSARSSALIMPRSDRSLSTRCRSFNNQRSKILMPSPSGIPLVGGCPPLSGLNGRLDTEHVPCANPEQREP